MSKKRKISSSEDSHTISEDDYVIALHCGAGSHSEKLEKSYKRLLRSACIAAADEYGRNGSVVLAAKESTICLEDSQLSNAGVGSYLNIDGGIECDASIMTNSKAYGAVGSLSMCRNPISVATCILEQSLVPLSYGRQRPCFLVGEGALDFAKSNIERTVVSSCSELETDHTIEKYRRSKQLIEGSLPSPEVSAAAENDIQDTVGSIVVNISGKACATSSSGGMNLKYKGRVGVAAIYGCGCWVEESKSGDVVACSTTGNGEELMKSLMASSLAKYVINSERRPSSELMSEIMEVENPLSNTEFGALSICLCPSQRFADVSFVHSSPSMAVGIFSSRMRNPKVFISRNMDHVNDATLREPGKQRRKYTISGYIQSFD